MRRSLSLAALLAAAPLTSQLPPPSTPQPAAEAAGKKDVATKPDLERVLEDLARAHGGDEASRSAKSFQGKLSITPTAKTADKTTVLLDVRFRSPQLIRYMVDEGDRRAERGRDQEGPWTRLGDDEPQSLMTRDYEGDRKQLDKHIGLARQLLSYLDPARVARELKQPVLAEEQLVINSRKQVPCFSITGTADRFPLYFLGGEPRQVQLKLWIDAATHLLIGVEAFPLDEQGAAAADGEFIYMPRHGNRNGILLPAVMVFDQVLRGRRQPSAKVEIQQLDLDPGLSDEKFSRNQPW